MCCGNLDAKGTKYGLEGIKNAIFKLKIKVILFGFKKQILKSISTMNGFKPLQEIN